MEHNKREEERGKGRGASNGDTHILFRDIWDRAGIGGGNRRVSSLKQQQQQLEEAG